MSTTSNAVDRAVSLLHDADTLTATLKAHLATEARAELRAIWPSLTAIRYDIDSQHCDDGTYVMCVEDIELVLEVQSGDEHELYVGSLSTIDCNPHEFEELTFDHWIKLGVDQGALDAARYAAGDYEATEPTDPIFAPLWTYLGLTDLRRAFQLIVLLLVHRPDDNGDIELSEAHPAPVRFDAAPIERLSEFVATVPNLEPADAEEAA